MDAFYFSVTTLTTVGVCDLAPKAAMGKLFTAVYTFASLGIILALIDTMAKETLGRQTRKSGSYEGYEDAPAS